MQNIRNFTTSLAICAMLFCSTGCGAVLVGGAAAVGTYAYMNGQAKGTYNSSIKNAFSASLATCKELSIPVTKETMDGASSEITGKYYGDTVTISLDLVGDNLTEITVRVGYFGNESASRRIHNAISQKL